MTGWRDFWARSSTAWCRGLMHSFQLLTLSKIFVVSLDGWAAQGAHNPVHQHQRAPPAKKWPRQPGHDDVQGLTFSRSCCSIRCLLRMPRNDQATARTVRSRDPLAAAARNAGLWLMSLLRWAPARWPRRWATTGRRRLAPTSKKVYDSVMVVTSFDSLGSITNATGHCFLLARLQRVLVEAEALQLVEVRRRLVRRVAGNGLRGHACGSARSGTRTSPWSAHRGAPARALCRLEIPGPARIGVELDRDGAARVHLRVAPARARPCRQHRCRAPGARTATGC
jgi:hypothetical protein